MRQLLTVRQRCSRSMGQCVETRFLLGGLPIDDSDSGPGAGDPN